MTSGFRTWWKRKYAAPTARTDHQSTRCPTWNVRAAKLSPLRSSPDARADVPHVVCAIVGIAYIFCGSARQRRRLGSAGVGTYGREEAKEVKDAVEAEEQHPGRALDGERKERLDERDAEHGREPGDGPE